MPPKFDKSDQILEELRLLHAKVDNVDTKLQTLTDTVSGIRTDVDKNTGDIASLRREFDEHKASSSSDILQLKTAFNNREQQLRSSTIRIFNFQVVPRESVDNYQILAARVFDRIIQPALAAAVAAGDLGRVPNQAAAIEACFRAFSPSEPAPGSPPPPVGVGEGC